MRFLLPTSMILAKKQQQKINKINRKTCLMIFYYFFLQLHQLLRKARDAPQQRNCKSDEKCKWEVYDSKTRLPEYDIPNE